MYEIEWVACSLIEPLLFTRNFSDHAEATFSWCISLILNSQEFSLPVKCLFCETSVILFAIVTLLYIYLKDSHRFDSSAFYWCVCVCVLCITHYVKHIHLNVVNEFVCNVHHADSRRWCTDGGLAPDTITYAFEQLLRVRRIKYSCYRIGRKEIDIHGGDGSVSKSLTPDDKNYVIQSIASRAFFCLCWCPTANNQKKLQFQLYPPVFGKIRLWCEQVKQIFRVSCSCMYAYRNTQWSFCIWWKIYE